MKNGNNLSTQIQDEGRLCVIRTEQRENFRFENVWLRHNCHCPECKQDHTGQKLLDISEIDMDDVISCLKIVDENLEIKWTDHEGFIPLKFLIANSYTDLNQQERLSWINQPKLQKIGYSEVKEGDKGILRWLKDINMYGASLLTNVPVQDKMVCKVAELIAPVLKTIYDTDFEVKSVPNPINIAYSDVPLDFHIDLNYYESPPGLLMLHCTQFDECVEGGESMLLDIFHVAECFRNKFPDDFHILTKIPATFQKVHFNRDSPVFMKYQRPHIVLNHRGEIVGVNWSPPFEGPLKVKQEDVLPYYRAYTKFAKEVKNSTNKIVFRMKPGDLLTVNNRRLLHARKGFKLNGGVRCLQGCYVGIDDYKNRLQVLSVQLGDEERIKPVGNQCWST